MSITKTKFTEIILGFLPHKQRQEAFNAQNEQIRRDCIPCLIPLSRRKVLEGASLISTEKLTDLTHAITLPIQPFEKSQLSHHLFQGKSTQQNHSFTYIEFQRQNTIHFFSLVFKTCTHPKPKSKLSEINRSRI